MIRFAIGSSSLSNFALCLFLSSTFFDPLWLLTSSSLGRLKARVCTPARASPAEYISLTMLSGAERVVYLACDRARRAVNLRRLVEEFQGSSWSAKDLGRMLRPFIERGLMLKDGNQYLSLALSVGPYAPPSGSLKRLRGHRRALEALAEREALIRLVRVAEIPRSLMVGTGELEVLRPRRKRPCPRGSSV